MFLRFVCKYKGIKIDYVFLEKIFRQLKPESSDRVIEMIVNYKPLIVQAF